MISSEKRIAANRSNAQKSTGPRTEEGKSRSRRNALKHGLRSSGAVILDEDQTALEREIADWEAHFEPEGPLARAMVRRAALSAIRLERCGREEAARLDERRRHAARRWHLDRKKEVEALAARLPIDPCRAAPALRETPEGCSWMMARWRLLRLALKGRGRWTIDEFAQSLHLLGRSEQSHRRELSACRLTAAHLATQSGRSAEEAASAGLLSEEDGRDWLDRRIVRELRRLRGRRESLRADRRRDVGCAADLVLFDARPAAILMRRYESAALADLNRCVSILAKSPPRPEGEPPRSRGRRDVTRPAAETIEAIIAPSPAADTAGEIPEERPRSEAEKAVHPVDGEAVGAPNEPKSPRRRARPGRGASIVLALLLGVAVWASARPIAGSDRAGMSRRGGDLGARSGPRPLTLTVVAIGASALSTGSPDRSVGGPVGTIVGARVEGESGQDGPGGSPVASQGGPPRS